MAEDGPAQAGAQRIGREQCEWEERLRGTADSLCALLHELLPCCAHKERPAARRLTSFLRSAAGLILEGVRGLLGLLKDSLDGNADPRWFCMEQRTGALFTPGPCACTSLPEGIVE